VTPAGVEARLELDAKDTDDIRNLRARLSVPEHALELLTTFAALPEQFSMEWGVPGTADDRPAYAASVDALREALEVVDGHGERRLRVGWSLGRDVVESNAALVDEQLADALVALGSVFRLLAWSPEEDADAIEREDDDELSTGRSRSTMAVERPRRTRPVRIEREPRRPPPPNQRPARRVRDEPWTAKDEEAANGVASAQDAVAPGAAEAHEPTEPARVMSSFPPARRTRLRRVRTLDVDPSLPVEKGTRVQVQKGPFAGKIGVVQELDARGMARVMLGLLAMSIPASNLVATAEGRERPLLGSSHRKPAPVR
jgi:hypothetical protein